MLKFFLRVLGKPSLGLSLVESLIVVSIIALLGVLIVPAYRASTRSYSLSTTFAQLQGRARSIMERLEKEIGKGMVVDRTDEPDTDPLRKDWIPANGVNEPDDAYTEQSPVSFIYYLPSASDPSQQGDQIAIYSALPDDGTTDADPSTASRERVDLYPVDPANHESWYAGLRSQGYAFPDIPLLYLRRWSESIACWQDPEPLLRLEEEEKNQIKVTQLSFVLGGGNEDRVILTLELARKDSTGEWRKYKISSAIKMGAR